MQRTQHHSNKETFSLSYTGSFESSSVHMRLSVLSRDRMGSVCGFNTVKKKDPRIDERLLASSPSIIMHEPIRPRKELYVNF